MPKRRLMWQLFPSYLVVIILAITAVTLFLAASMKKFYLDETAADLNSRTLLFRNQFNTADLHPGSSVIDSLCKKLGHDSGTRFTVILPSGIVIGDTDDDPRKMDNHSNRPEIQEALLGSEGVSTRYSHTLFETMMYVAEPVSLQGKILAVVRSALPITDIDHAMGKLYGKILLTGLLIAFISALLSFYISRRISLPLERMRNLANHYSKGEFEHKLPSGNSLEMDELATAMNKMAAELDDKIQAIVGQRNELEAVLSSMTEGVLAFDTGERLVSLNLAASQMLGLKLDSAKGQYIQEIIRQVQLQKLVASILENGEPLEDEIELQDKTNRILRVHGTILRDIKNRSLGVLVVLNDITQLRRLEKVRRDFVANVSHELRTPITSIKGFVETLRDGAIENPDDARRFLSIIANQTDRLNTIIDDLLVLSKIEETEQGEMRLEEGMVKPVLQNALEICNFKAKAKNVSINLICDEEMRAKINPDLLEQAIINLLDNAIKYSSDGGEVNISAIKDNQEIRISVQDNGPGIEKKHLPRLFERFYTADKARSRELGGSGLGLAIVRHIVLAHNGSVSVESTPGKGSIFTIHLPEFQ
jgi:two-component system, OmpR family, phosphate regulon sensor histidine kinase PhoR